MAKIEELRAEIEATRLDYHRLLEIIPDEVFEKPSDNPAWNIRQVLYHMSLAPRMLGEDLKMFMSESKAVPTITRLMPKALFDWLNKQVTRYGARKKDREGLRQAYDAATDKTLGDLGSVGESDMAKTQPYPDWDPLLSGEVSLEDLFHYVRRHFEAHAAQIQRVLDLDKGEEDEPLPG